MQIAVDARPLAFPGNGNARYLSGMLTELFRLPGIHWQLLSHRGIDASYTGLIARENVELLIEASVLPRIGPIWYQTGLVQMLKRLKPDLFWGTLGLLPRNYKERVGIPALLNVHDLNAFIAPDTMVRWNRWQHRLLAESSISNAQTVLCLSETTRNDILQFFPHTSKQKLKVVYPGIQPAEGMSVRPSDLPFYSEEFYLSVGTVEPRKNYRTLIQAYLSARRENPYLYPLVIAGRKGWGLDSITEDLIAGKLKNDGIHFLNGPNEKELTWLYQQCHATFFPSLHEGFGLPVLEALQSGKWTVVSDIPIFREVCPQARFVEPQNADRWKAELQSLYGKQAPKPPKFDKKFWSWPARAKTVAEIIQEAEKINKAY